MKTKVKQGQTLQLEPKLVQRDERSKSADSQKSRRRSFIETQGTDFSNKPSPLDFDAFLPWMCAQYNCPKTVTVMKTAQEVYKKKDKRSSSTRSRSSKTLKAKADETDMRKSKESHTSAGETAKVFVPDNKNNLLVKSVYDTKGHLVEVAIMGATDIPRKVMKAIAICVPFHSLFTRLTIQWGGVSSLLLHDIGTLLPTSNITDIRLDHCFVPEGNFYVLLEHVTQLRNLFLNNCHINDEVCVRLVSKIQHGSPGSSLLILELGSNFITDVGAKCIGQVLRANRSLLHLNLSDNKITDVGATALLSALSEFPLSVDEIIAMKQRKLEHAKTKAGIYKRCYEEVFKRNQKREMESNSANSKKTLTKLKSPKKEKLPVPLKAVKRMSEFRSEKAAADLAEKMMKDIIGDFVDPFDSKGLKMKDSYYYGVGNLSLCSLNLAYNLFTFETIIKIHKVLKYQSQVPKEKPQTGLMRIVFDGNRLPADCIEYHEIEELLKNVIYTNILMNSPINTRKVKTTTSVVTK